MTFIEKQSELNEFPRGKRKENRKNKIANWAILDTFSINVE